MKKLGRGLALVLMCGLIVGMAGCDGTGTWIDLSPTGDLPSPRSTAMVYDSADGKAILFGGHAMEQYPDTACGDTWAYDPATNTWSRLNPTGDIPPPRQGHSIAYDSTSGKVILFGGWSGSTKFNDTWVYDPVANRWADLNPSGTLPPVRWGASMVYDSRSNKVILFGGITGENYHNTTYNDTWAYDPVTNTWTGLHPAGTLPPARWGAPMIYDPRTGKVILFGGGDSEYDSLGDTWAYDPAAGIWVDLDPRGDVPPSRMSPSMACDTTTGRVILFGGLATAGYGNVPDSFCRDTWAYDPAGNRWTNLHPGGDLPPAASDYSMVFDATHAQLVLFGGWARGTEFNSTWVYRIGP